MDLTKQQQKVFDYILKHPGATTAEIQRNTYITCPSARITEMRQLGVPIKSIGHKRFEGSRAFEMYVIDLPQPAPKPVQVSEQATGLAKQLTLV